MLARISSGAVLGIDAYGVQVEVDIDVGVQVFQVVGLPKGAVREARRRIPSALESAGFDYPTHKITVNLAPADIKKDGTAFDLPMAIGILAANRSLPVEREGFALEDYLLVGELGLDGEIRSVEGALPLAVLARDTGLDGIVLPEANAPEAAVVSGIEVYPVEHLTEVAAFVRGDHDLAPIAAEPLDGEAGGPDYPVDFDEVAGQTAVKRALEVAAAGGHNVLLIGPPGAGKSMLAKRLPTILPDLSFEEALETTKIYSVTGELPEDQGLIRRRPFRNPHHTISDVGIIGGGSGVPQPGEVSLAHNGVLFLDELPEFPRNVLEVLRQPLEEGEVTISRSLSTLTYPANVMLVAAMNPCRCGYYGTDSERCECSAREIKRYRSKISGPLLDRIDIQVEVSRVPYRELKKQSHGEPSRVIRGRVREARNRQAERFAASRGHSNAQMAPSELREYCRIDDEGHDLMERVVDSLGMSARAYDRILKVARTVADLEGDDGIDRTHLAEAVQYRTLDRDIDRPRRSGRGVMS